MCIKEYAGSPQKQDPDREAVVIQAVGEGEAFSRRFATIFQGDEEVELRQTRQVAVVFSFDTQLGTVEIHPTKETKADLTQIPHKSLEGLYPYYANEKQAPSVTTVFKHGASVVTNKLPERGNSLFTIPKPAKTFGSSVLGKQIEENMIRKNEERASKPPSVDGLPEIPF